MSKRKLSEHQKRRVGLARQKSAPSANLEQTQKDTANPNDQTTDTTSHQLGPKQPGLVVTNFGKRLLVTTQTGEIYNCAVRQHLGKLVAGDMVTFQTDFEPKTGIVSAVAPRHHVMTRPGFRGQTRMVAANIDLILVVAPVAPGVHPDMIDRYLVGAHQLQLPVLILINKIDLIQDDAGWETLAELLLPYDDLEIPLLPVSTETGEGLDELIELLDTRNSVIVGPSGAGKSSLINALIPDLEIKVSALSESTGLGKHTTTNSILYHLPSNQGLSGNIIDSPGVREFSPSPCQLHELEQAYPDFSPFLGKCKYSNCTHTIEPKCAIIDAVESGEIHATRYQSFQRLRLESASAKG